MTSLKQQMDTFDILFKNFFAESSLFMPVMGTKIGHPVDIFETSKGLHFNVAATGLTADDIVITIEDDILRIKYNKPNSDDFEQSHLDRHNNMPDIRYYYRGIASRSFNLGYKLSSKFDLSASNAKIENGLLRIIVPYSTPQETKPIKLTIN